MRMEEQISALSASGLTGDALLQQSAQATGMLIGPLSILPPLIAIALAFVTKEVVTSLLCGVLTGYAMLERLSGGANILSGGYNVVEHTVNGLIAVISDPFNCSVILLCLMIGGLVALIHASGGFLALASRLAARVKTPKGAELAAQGMGILIFFDDYANSLIVGSVMRPVTDKLGVSREKLAYIVDSTAAPVAGIAIISSWISAELSAIEQGLAILGTGDSAYSLFLGSLPYCFYNIFTLVLLFFGILLGREYGPMLRYEAQARQGTSPSVSSQAQSQPTNPHTERADMAASPSQPDQVPQKEKPFQTAKAPGSVWAAILPIVLLCAIALIEFYFSGLANARAQGLIDPAANPWSPAAILAAFGAADTITILIKATLLASLLALVLGIATKAFSYIKGIEAWIAGASELLITGVILCLAWTLSGVITQLGTTYYLVELVTLSLPYWCLPALIFLVCCAISFAAGSYGSMLIVMPMAVPIAYSAAAAAAGAIAAPQAYICACVASVLSGSIFGDHCSPITDTTILSSIGAGCGNIEHVKTQLPYALTAAAIAALCGALPAGLGISPLVSIALGAAACLAVLYRFGKQPG